MTIPVSQMAFCLLVVVVYVLVFGFGMAVVHHAYMLSSPYCVYFYEPDGRLMQMYG